MPLSRNQILCQRDWPNCSERINGDQVDKETLSGEDLGTPLSQSFFRGLSAEVSDAGTSFSSPDRTLLGQQTVRHQIQSPIQTGEMSVQLRCVGAPVCC